MNYVVEARELRKAYAGTVAVDNVSLKIAENKIYGLLGRNGAGKTTLMHLMTAQQLPTSGELKVFGENPYENDRVLRRTCFIKESQKYPDTFRVKDVLETAADFFPGWDREFAYSLADEFRLPVRRGMKKLSRGMLASVGIIVGIASRAPLTIFDEPYLGLDAVARSLFYDRLIEDYTEHPRTIVLSTHLIDEISKLLEHVILIEGGKLLLDEDADALRGWAIRVSGPALKVNEFVEGRKTVHRQTLAGLVSAVVIGNGDGRERERAQRLGLSSETVSMQQLVVHMTSASNANPERKAEI